jgi:hypothetical protein
MISLAFLSSAAFAALSALSLFSKVFPSLLSKFNRKSEKVNS